MAAVAIDTVLGWRKSGELELLRRELTCLPSLTLCPFLSKFQFRFFPGVSVMIDEEVIQV